MLRVIARMNAGGPAYHVSLLSGKLDPERYETLLVAGRVGPGEASMDDVAERYGVRIRKLDALGPELRPRRDLKAFLQLIKIVRSFRPHVVHTHTAKAGFLGRMAACAIRPRPLVIHTYHGHVLEGYFGRGTSVLFRILEWLAARISDRLLAVSQATADDLVRLRVARRGLFTVIPIGLELDGFGDHPKERERFRGSLNLSPGDVVATYVGRMVPIKRLERAIEAVALARQRGALLHLVLVGDGECRARLENYAAECGLGGVVSFTGYRKDLVSVIAGSDVALLTSDNEGTPVFLIEAAAGGRPAVATSVGGVPEVVTERTGVLVSPHDISAMADGLTRLAKDPSLRIEMGSLGAAHVRTRFAADRLVADIDTLYTDLLESRRP